MKTKILMIIPFLFGKTAVFAQWTNIWSNNNMKPKNNDLMIKLSLLTISFLLTSSVFGQWKESAFVPSSSLFELAFPDSNAAYITGDFGLVYKSTDAGVRWTQIYNFGGFASLGDPNFINADTGFVTANGGVYRTFDGGISWAGIGANWGQPNGIPISRIKITGQKLFASYENNDTAYIIKSDNYGTNWETIFQNYELNAQPYVFSFMDSLNGYFINPNELQRVYKTNDGGMSVDTLFITNGPIVLQERYDFKDLQNGYLYGTPGSSSYPTRTWNTGTFYFPIDLDGFGVLPVLDLDFNTSKLFASTLYGKIFYSLNNGETWVEQTTPINDPISSISFLNENQGIAISDNKVLYTNNGGFTGVSEMNLLSIVKVYPNPSSEIVTIEINTVTPIQNISLTDIRGKLIKNIKITERSFDIKNLNSGIYLLRIETKQNTLTKKIIIE